MCGASYGGLQAYKINSNQITGSAFIGTVGLDWQFSGVGNFSSVPGESGLVASLARPGGNINGTTSISGDVIAKRLQLVTELIPNVARIAILVRREYRLKTPSLVSLWTMSGLQARPGPSCEFRTQTIGQLHRRGRAPLPARLESQRLVMRDCCGSPKAWFRCGSSRTSQSRFMVSR